MADIVTVADCIVSPLQSRFLFTDTLFFVGEFCFLAELSDLSTQLKIEAIKQTKASNPSLF